MSTTSVKKPVNRTKKPATTPVVLLDTQSVLNNQPKKGRGRPLGSRSDRFIYVNLEILNKIFAPTSIIRVDKIYASMLEINKIPSLAAPVESAAVENGSSESELRPVVTEFTDENPAALPEGEEIN